MIYIDIRIKMAITFAIQNNLVGHQLLDIILPASGETVAVRQNVHLSYCPDSSGHLFRQDLE